MIFWVWARKSTKKWISNSSIYNIFPGFKISSPSFSFVIININGSEAAAAAGSYLLPSMAAAILRGSILTRRRFSLCFSSSQSQSQSLPPIPSTISDESETLVFSVASIIKGKGSKSRWNYIKTVYPNGFSSNEVSQITVHLRNNPRLALRFFLWSEKKSLCTHDLLSYSSIIHILARARLKTLALTLIQTAIRLSEEESHHHSPDDPDQNPPKIFEMLTKTYRSCDSAPFVFDLLIRACLDAKKIDSTLTIVRMLRSRSIYPKASTCNSLIRSISKLRGSDAGYLMYREVFGVDQVVGSGDIRNRVYPNVQTFNTLMLCFYQDGLMEKVEEVWIEMEKFDCVPNVFSYSVLMAVCCDEGKMEEAMKLWEEIKVKQIEPDVVAYNTMIKGFCDNGEMRRAEELFQDMELKEMETTCLTYEHLIKGYCKIGDVDAVMLVYKDMGRKGFKPEASTVEQVVVEMCNGNRVSEGLGFLRNVMKRGEFFPSRVSYEILIKGLCKEGKMEDALMLQAKMVGKGFETNSEIYSAFIEGYSKVGNEAKAGKLRKEMLNLGLQQDG